MFLFPLFLFTEGPNVLTTSLEAPKMVVGDVLFNPQMLILSRRGD